VRSARKALTVFALSRPIERASAARISPEASLRQKGCFAAAGVP
jgi:hypothetical protein